MKREPIATSAPTSIAPRSRGMSAGSCDRSASSVTMPAGAPSRFLVFRYARSSPCAGCKLRAVTRSVVADQDIKCGRKRQQPFEQGPDGRGLVVGRREDERVNAPDGVGWVHAPLTVQPNDIVHDAPLRARVTQAKLKRLSASINLRTIVIVTIVVAKAP